MANQKGITIYTVTKASIQLDQLAGADRTREGEFTKEETFDTDAKKAGYYAPMIQINGHRVDRGIKSFSLDSTGFLPVCTFSFQMLDSVFLSVSYPKDGDIFSLYLRSVGDVYKPIRMDFNIISVDSLPVPYDADSNDDGQFQYFTIVGECRIPGIYTQRIKAFKNKTSYDTLLEVSQDLGLGFASNDSNLDDVMNWICPNFSYYDFIETVTNHSYKDEFSYFGSWVDLYYNLNFVNLGNNYSVEEFTPEMIKTTVQDVSGIDINNDTTIPGKEQIFQEKPLIFSNSQALSGTMLYPLGYTLISQAGQNTNLSGYVTTLQIFDGESNETNDGYVKYDIESITVQDIPENALLQKGRANESIYKGEKRAVWVGENKTGDSAQTHPNYLHAPIQNEINKLDSEKFTLQLEFNKFLPFIYRGQVVPVLIWVKGKGARKRNSGNVPNKEGNTTGENVKDNFLSGNYVVSGFEIFYDPVKGSLGQIINLCKKTWYLNSSGGLPKVSPFPTGVG